jgi:hypothetical protein
MAITGILEHIEDKDLSVRLSSVGRSPIVIHIVILLYIL